MLGRSSDVRYSVEYTLMFGNFGFKIFIHEGCFEYGVFQLPSSGMQANFVVHTGRWKGAV